MTRFFLSFLFIVFSIPCFSQANYSVTDPEKDFKEAEYFFLKGEYSLAYPLLKPLLDKYPENTKSSHAYLNQDIEYYFVVCELKLNQSIAEEAAKRFIDAANNEPRQQLMSFHLAQYYFLRNDYARAVVYYERAGYNNLSNEQIADAKFELAYSYFEVGQYNSAKPLFDEIHQLPSNKYYYDANYYYGFLSYRDRDYNNALSSFQKVESIPKYRGLVPYYISQIYYFQGNKDQALQYGQSKIGQNDVYNRKEMNLLMGQIYFEKKEFSKALPLLEAYVKNTDKVSKEVMYELSYCYYNANDVQKAIEGFKQLSNEKDSLGQNSMYLLGDLYLKTGQKENARNAFLYSADNNSNAKQQEISRFNYAKLSYELGYQDIALNSLNKFLDLYPQSAYANEAKEIIINLLANTNNYSEALSLYQSFSQPTPTMKRIYPKILFGKATEYINNQKLDEADDLLTKVIRDPDAGPVLPFAYFWKGEVSYRLNRYDEAIKNMNSYLQAGGIQGEANPKDASYVLGYSYLNLENYSQALANFKQVAPVINSQSSNLQQDAYVRSADCYFMMKDYAAAKNMYQNVINNGLDQSDYALYQVALINGIRSPSEKIKTFNTLTEKYPQSDLVAESYMQIANAYMVQEKFRDAIPYLNKILDIKSASGQYPKVYLKLGLANYNLNNNNEALQDYQKLINQYPQSEEANEALDNLRNIYVEMGKPNDYVAFVQKAGKVISVSEADSVTYAAAELQYSNNDCAAAISSFNNYLSKFPQGAYALNANFYKSECYSRNKDWQNALKGYEAVLGQGASPFAERSAYAAARINYFELKDYQQSKTYFSKLLELSTTPENQLEALRGLVRSYYQTKDFAEANNIAKELLTKKGISTDDKAIANLVLGKSLQVNNQCPDAIKAFKEVSATNKSEWGAEARFETANCYYMLNQLPTAEKAALEVIKVTGSYDYWVAKSYILLGDIYLAEGDYFNAKATYKSVADNATIPDLKKEAQTKLDAAIADEQQHSKVQSSPSNSK
ncbi:tetratricopeptide repeat protein [Hanamia caeni]|uniref:Tetratricopeptide repeat protein n=1 Tax=Hanamia caeni TaxID=2294116 RepID=A0A3M9ND17_9BACT|nr:tetratricopeptide repeat protein [Hanamia caeni]RNI35641.1 tetratricopeptide repeat protein [Hanamia caeni]